MCSNYQRRKSYRDYVAEFSETRLPLIFPEAHAAPNLEPQTAIRPTDPAPIFRMREHGVEMVTARWWLLPYWHKGPLKGFKLATFGRVPGGGVGAVGKSPAVATVESLA